MKVFITGIAGFVGSHTAEAFKNQGDVVVGADNFHHYYDPAQKKQNKKELEEQGILVYDADIRGERIRLLIREFNPDVIVHVAAMAGVRASVENPLNYVDVNIQGSQNIFEAAKEVGAHVVAASSSSIYGDRNDTPFRESDRVNKQISPYAATKRAMELLGHVHNQVNELPVTVLRFFTVYGPRGRPDMAPYLFMDGVLNGKQIMQFGDGTSARDYTYVEDIAQGVVAAANNPNGYKIYNLGNNQPIPLIEFISTIEKVVGKKANKIIKELPAGDVQITFADISRAQKDLDYDPSTPLETGLKKLYEWMVKQQTGEEKPITTST